jgi:hypothetical protein
MRGLRRIPPRLKHSYKKSASGAIRSVGAMSNTNSSELLDLSKTARDLFEKVFLVILRGF